MNEVQVVTDERGARYGDFRNNALVAQHVKSTLHDALADNPRFEVMSASDRFVLLEGLDQIALKLSRIVTGDPAYDDNYIDIEGYSKITRERVCKPRSK